MHRRVKAAAVGACQKTMQRFMLERQTGLEQVSNLCPGAHKRCEAKNGVVCGSAVARVIVGRACTQAKRLGVLPDNLPLHLPG